MKENSLRRIPLNVLTTLAMVGAFWVVGGILGANQLANSVALQNYTTTDLVHAFQIVTIILAAIGYFCSCIWFIYGSRESTAADLRRAWSVWLTLWISLIILSALGVLALVLTMSGETLTFGNMLFVFVITSLLTWLLFWAASLFLSPRAVQFVPLGKR